MTQPTKMKVIQDIHVIHGIHTNGRLSEQHLYTWMNERTFTYRALECALSTLLTSPPKREFYLFHRITANLLYVSQNCLQTINQLHNAT